MNARSLIEGPWFIVVLLACGLLTPITAKGQLAPPQPVPQDSDTITTLTPTLRWHASPGAVSYQIEIYQITHNNLIIRIEADSTEEQYDIPPRKLLHFNRYKWWARAVDSSGFSLWSQAQTFKVLPEFNCDIENDQDCDGIPDNIEMKHFKTDPNKRTLFVRPKKKIGEGENDFERWGNFLHLFPGSSNGIANIRAFVEAKIEVVVLGAENHTVEFFKKEKGYNYKPEDHPDWPCDIMEIVLEQADTFYDKLNWDI